MAIERPYRKMVGRAQPPERTAIVTGASSFVGCHLARAYADAGWAVVAVTSRARETYDGIRAQRLDFIAGRVAFAVCDLTDADAAAVLVDEYAPVLWVQHAGYADNYASRDYDLEKSLALNVVALEPLYRTLYGRGCGVIVTGSSMEYSASDAANREDDVCWPDLPYGVSKLAETVEAHRLACQYGVATRVARLYIPVGPLDAPGKLMDFVTRQLVAGKTAGLSPCEQKRDFLGIRDLCNAYVKLADDFHRQTFDVFNICSGAATRVKTLLEGLADAVGADRALLDFGARGMRPGETMVSFGDNTKARTVLGWTPRPLEDALKDLVEHVRTAD
ncbi:MAG: NAD(P)-dependent oxidoreductase [Alphaproteobacteria bacterium]|nr:NAD(P)-dependent oxidoreductase [Alphaproteobacteria bacterium]MBF0249714.1 NAD(P)-dependent oxidoreductase [Alphaproteobacteria bacterium]